MLDSRDQADRFHELTPAIALRRQHLLPRGGETIITAATLAGLLHPATANPSPLLEAVKQGIKRSDIEAERAARTQLDQLPDVVSVAGPIFDQGRMINSALPFFSSRSRIGEAIYCDTIYSDPTTVKSELPASAQRTYL